MMLESQKNLQSYDSNLVYEIVSDSSLPEIDHLRGASNHMMSSTSVNHQTYKYWNPANFDKNANNSTLQRKTVDELIGKRVVKAIKNPSRAS